MRAAGAATPQVPSPPPAAPARPAAAPAAKPPALPLPAVDALGLEAMLSSARVGEAWYRALAPTVAAQPGVDAFLGEGRAPSIYWLRPGEFLLDVVSGLSPARVTALAKRSRSCSRARRAGKSQAADAMLKSGGATYAGAAMPAS